MSKSLGNFTTLPDLLARHDARAYRILVLRAHYRSPIEVTPETLVDAEKALDRLDGLARRFGVGGLLEQTAEGFVVEGVEPATGLDEAPVAAFRASMDDDLDTPGALAGIFELVTAAHSMADAGDDEGAAALARTAAVLVAVLGVSLRQESGEIDEAGGRRPIGRGGLFDLAGLLPEGHAEHRHQRGRCLRERRRALVVAGIGHRVRRGHHSKMPASAPGVSRSSSCSLGTQPSSGTMPTTKPSAVCSSNPPNRQRPSRRSNVSASTRPRG